MNRDLLLRLALCQELGIQKKWWALSYAKKYGRETLTFGDLQRLFGYQRFSPRLESSWQALAGDGLAEALTGQDYLTIDSPLYPEQLRQLHYPPLALFYAGRRELLQKRLLGFVGARDASSYGRQVVAKFIPEMVAANYVIVSGLARGIDSYAHMATLASSGFTIGVLGNGLDVCYPVENRRLYEILQKEHLVITEYPLGTPPKKYHFPQRNRIIAGLCKGLCVVEAKARSGSLITAQQALEAGREVFAVPGEILSGRQDGCHSLIQDGAKCVYRPQDLLEELPEF